MPYIDLTRQTTNKGDVQFSGQGGTGMKWEYASLADTIPLESQAAYDGSYAEFTSDAAHDLTVGDLVIIKNSSGGSIYGSSYPDAFLVVKLTPTATTFTLDTAGSVAVPYDESSSSTHIATKYNNKGSLKILKDANTAAFEVDSTTGDVKVDGTLTVTGQTLFIDTAQMNFSDSLLGLNFDSNGAAEAFPATSEAGFQIGDNAFDGAAVDEKWAQFIWDKDSRKWYFNKDADGGKATLVANLEGKTTKLNTASNGIVMTTGSDGSFNVGQAAKGDVGLGSVDNTPDAGKPVSTAQATAIAAVQTDVDANESASDTAIAAEATARAAAITTVQADVDANESASDTAIAAEATARAAAITTVQADVDANESASDTAIAAEATARAAAITTVQADVDANESASDTAIAAVQTDVDANESASDTAIAAEATARAAAITTVQADVDANESASDTAIAAVQADVDANESASDTAIAAEATARAAAITTVQADVDANESASDTAIAAVQTDVDANESASDTAIAAEATARAAAITAEATARDTAIATADTALIASGAFDSAVNTLVSAATGGIFEINLKQKQLIWNGTLDTFKLTQVACTDDHSADADVNGTAINCGKADYFQLYVNGQFIEPDALFLESLVAADKDDDVGFGPGISGVKVTKKTSGSMEWDLADGDEVVVSGPMVTVIDKT